MTVCCLYIEKFVRGKSYRNNTLTKRSLFPLDRKCCSRKFSTKNKSILPRKFDVTVFKWLDRQTETDRSRQKDSQIPLFYNVDFINSLHKDHLLSFQYETEPSENLQKLLYSGCVVILTNKHTIRQKTNTQPGRQTGMEGRSRVIPILQHNVITVGSVVCFRVQLLFSRFIQ